MAKTPLELLGVRDPLGRLIRRVTTAIPYEVDITREECKKLPSEHIDATWNSDKDKCVMASKADALKAKIYDLLYFEGGGRDFPELLTIIILDEKTHYFDFLKAGTLWDSRGKWKDNPLENNTIIQVMFMDTVNETVSQELEERLEDYNKEVIKERQLYVTTEAVEQTSLD